MISLALLTALMGAVVADTSPAPVDFCPAAQSDTPLAEALRDAMRRYHVPGATWAVVRRGQPVLLGAAGCADLARRIPVDPVRTAFRAASLSKSFTAALILELVADGALVLDRDVNGYLRDWQVPATFAQPVTLAGLLTHSAGFEERVIGYAARALDSVRPLGDYLRDRMPARRWAPGQVTSYSNHGYALAGYLAETAAGVPFPSLMEARVLAPLGMVSSTFTQPLPGAIEAGTAVGYRCTGDGCQPVPRDYRHATPPGGLVSTAADLARFLAAELDSGRVGAQQALRAATVLAMQRPQFRPAAGLPAFGFGLVEDPQGDVPAWSHAGGSPGFSAHLFLFPDHSAGFVLLVNGGDSRFGATARDLLTREAIGRGPAPADRALPTNPAPAPPIGTYRLTRYSASTIENLPALFQGPLYVAAGAGDTILVSGLGGGSARFVPTGDSPGVYAEVGGFRRLARSQRNGSLLYAQLSFFGTTYPATYEALPWWDRPLILNEILSWVLAGPVLVLAAWPLGALVAGIRRRRRGLPSPTSPAGAGWLRAAAVAFVGLTLLFGFGFLARSVRLAENGTLVYGLPPALHRLVWMPYVLVGLASLLLAGALSAWRGRWWGVWSRTVLTLLALDSVAVIWLLHRWSYLPLHY